MHIEPSSALPPPPRHHRAVPRRLAAAALLGLLAGTATALCLGAPAYRATAIVQVPDAGSPTRVALVNGAVVGAVSKSVVARAVVSLNEAGAAIPPANLAERLALAVGAPGTQAAGPGDRLIRALSSSLVARPGALAGTVEIVATLPRADQASLVATGIADAFVAEQDEVAAQARHRDELAAAARFEVLRASASAAHAKLSALGGDGPEPGATRAATDIIATDITATGTANLAAAVARRDAIARIIASGSPPLGEGKGMPAAVDALQTIYLDHIRQLAKARETLGDRHTTVISLKEAVQRAAAALTSEWHRLKVAADADASAAEAREDTARNSPPIRLAALAEARGAARRADAALVRAETAAADVVEAQPYRVIVRASTPTTAVGVPPATRLPLALLAGLVAAGLGMRITRRVPPPVRAAIEPVGEPVPREVPMPVAAPVARPAAVFAAEPTADPPAEPFVTLDASVELAELQAAIAVLSTQTDKTLDMPILAPAPQLKDQDALRQAMRDVLPKLAAIDPRTGALPTAMVAANEIGVTTMEAALALGRVAADAGYRVLVIEGGCPRAELAVAADPKVDPILVDMAGGLRVALRAEGGVGVLFLAPCFKDGTRIAAALARGGETPFVDDVADEFDLIVIDGGRAADCALEDWDADLAVRVARFASKRDDERFIATLGLTPDALLGTMAGSTFVPNAVPAAPVAAARVTEDQPTDLAGPAAKAGSVSGLQPARFHQPAHAPSSQARPSPLKAPHFAARRRVGLR